MFTTKSFESGMDVVLAGYNGVIINGEVFRILGAVGKSLIIRSTSCEKDETCQFDRVDGYVTLK